MMIYPAVVVDDQYGVETLGPGVFGRREPSCETRRIIMLPRHSAASPHARNEWGSQIEPADDMEHGLSAVMSCLSNGARLSIA
jgi:hypothetical protein